MWIDLNAVGIDISKGKSTVTVLQSDGKTIMRARAVSHTVSALNALARDLCALDGETKVVMEHTGRYYEPVAQVLLQAGLFVCAINPLLIKNYNFKKLHAPKTDKADAEKIAHYTLDNWDILQEHNGMDTIRYQLKTLNRQRELNVRNKTTLNNNLVSLLDQCYPDANRLFDSPVRADGTQKWVDFVHTFYHVDCVRTLSLRAFTARYQKWCSRHGYQFSENKAAEIHSGAKELLPLLQKDACSKLLIQQAAERLTAAAATVETLTDKMNEPASQLPEYPVVMEIYSVGRATGQPLIAEIGDVRRFAKCNALTAFAGVDPTTNQSGTFEAASRRTTKRGSPQLRKTLFNIMTIYLQKAPEDEPFYRFLDKKRAEGKPYYVYMTVGATKFLRIYYGRVNAYFATLKDLPPVDYDSTGLNQK